MTDEKRTKIRKFTNEYFLIYNVDTNDLIGRIMDMTPDGFMLISDEPIKIEKHFKCKMDFGKMVYFQRYIFFEAVIKWCDLNKHCHWYESGFQITKITDEDRETIEEIIEEWKIKGKKKLKNDICIDDDVISY